MEVRKDKPLYFPCAVPSVLPLNILRRCLFLWRASASWRSVVPRIVPGYLFHVPEIVYFFYVQFKITPNVNILNK